MNIWLLRLPFSREQYSKTILLTWLIPTGDSERFVVNDIPLRTITFWYSLRWWFNGLLAWCRFNTVPNNDRSKSKLYHNMLLWFLLHLENHHCQNMITYESSLQNDNRIGSSYNIKILSFGEIFIKAKWLMLHLLEIKRIIWSIVWTLNMKFFQNETDDIVIKMDEEGLSASTTMFLPVEFITVL